MDDDEQVLRHYEETRRELNLWREERRMVRGAREMEREMDDFREAEGRAQRKVKRQRAREDQGTPRAPLAPGRIASEVRAALRGDPRIKRPELIAVSVDGIGAVELRGAVGTPDQRLAAAHDARRVPGVFEVIDDELKVHPPVAPLRADDEIRVEAIEQLSTDRFRGARIHVKVLRGDVTLRGYVWDEADAATAVELVSKLPGVTEVSDQIKIRRARR